MPIKSDLFASGNTAQTSLGDGAMYQRILVPIDGSDAGRQGLAEALRLAPAWKATLRLLYVSCAYPFALEMANPADIEGYRRSLKERANHLLRDYEAPVRKAGVTVETAVRELERGTPGSAIVEEAATSRCDLVVMGTHGRSGFARTVAGSNAEEVVRKCVVPVLVVCRPKGVRPRSSAKKFTGVKEKDVPIPTLS
jgi:nucleotide-binding universal stress UspA family protein